MARKAVTPKKKKKAIRPKQAKPAASPAQVGDNPSAREDQFIRERTAPLMPKARYSRGSTTTPVVPIWRACGIQPRSVTTR